MWVFYVRKIRLLDEWGLVDFFTVGKDVQCNSYKMYKTTAFNVFIYLMFSCDVTRSVHASSGSLQVLDDAICHQVSKRIINPGLWV